MSVYTKEVQVKRKEVFEELNKRLERFSLEIVRKVAFTFYPGFLNEYQVVERQKRSRKWNLYNWWKGNDKLAEFRWGWAAQSIKIGCVKDWKRVSEVFNKINNEMQVKIRPIKEYY